MKNHKNFLPYIPCILGILAISACNNGTSATANNNLNGTKKTKLDPGSTTLYIYLQNQNLSQGGGTHYFYTDSPTTPTTEKDLIPSVGWDMSNHMKGQTNPGEGLQISNVQGGPECNFPIQAYYNVPESPVAVKNVQNIATGPTPSPTFAPGTSVLNPLGYTESVFSIATNGYSIVANPQIPANYFNASDAKSITCTATITAPDGYSQQITAVLEPTPQSLSPNANITFVGKGTDGKALTANNISMYVSSVSDYAPISQFQVSGVDNPVVSENVNVQPGGSSKVRIFGNVQNVIESGSPCIQYPQFTYNGQTGESLYIDVTPDGITPANPIQVSIIDDCHVRQPNTMHSISAAVQTVDRFQYGTFEVTMKPSPVSGTNSSFYSFFGDGDVTSDASIYLPFPWNGFLPWGYTWHEIDFEFVPGEHITSLQPQKQSDGFFTPSTAAAQIGQSMSLNAFEPGMADTYAYGSFQHHRYCPNANDPACLISTSFNPFDGQYHTYSFTWTPKEIRYYVDHTLINVLPIENTSAGTLLNGPLTFQSLFSNGGIKGLDGNFHATSPQAISMNFWIPGYASEFGGVFKNDTLGANAKIYDDYKEVTWSPCVNDQGSPDCNTSNSQKIGEEYTADGIAIGNTAHTWDFTHLTKSYGTDSSFFKDWMYAPLSGFDENNSTFVENNVSLDGNGLHLCMTDQWDHVATWNPTTHTYTPSVGCDGQPVLPVVGRASATNYNSILLNIQANYNGNMNLSQSGNAYGITPLLNPNETESASAPRATYTNNGWANNSTESSSCDNSPFTAPGLYCGGNGWYADPRFHYVGGSAQPKLQVSYYLSPVNVNTVTLDADNKTWELKANNQMFSVDGHNCTAIFEPSQIVIAPQNVYNVTATVKCSGD